MWVPRPNSAGAGVETAFPVKSEQIRVERLPNASNM